MTEQFKWVDYYEEFASKLLEYRNNRKELIDKIVKVYDVKNKEVELKNRDHESVSGMLLYAKTDEAVYPDHEYKMSGNTIAVRTLDLDKDFMEIKKQLDGIVERYLQY